MIRYHARWVLPITSSPIPHGTVAVHDGRIAYVGPRDGAPAGQDRDLGHALLLPGLVNVHTHLELTAMRGFLEDLDFTRWINTLNSSKRAVLDRDRMLDAARLGVEEGIRAGITMYADTCDSGVAFDAMIERGVRGIMFQEVFGPDPAQCGEAMAALRAKVDALRPRETPLVRVGISPHAPYTVSDDLFRATTAYAREESLPMAIHIAESEVESQLITAGEGLFADGLRKRGIIVAPRAGSPIDLLGKLGVLGVRPLLIHCVRLSDPDIHAIAEERCPVAHCPASNAKLGHGVAPLAELVEHGVTVGLGSDSMASNNRMDILEEARLALLWQRARLRSTNALSARTMLELATIGGARALGVGNRVGSLEVGKDADLAAFTIGHLAPTAHPEAAAIFAATGSCARFVTVAGRVLLDEDGPMDRDDGLAARVQATADELMNWHAARGTGYHPHVSDRTHDG